MFHNPGTVSMCDSSGGLVGTDQVLSLVASSKFSGVSWTNGGTSRPLNTEGTSGSSALVPHLFTRLLPSFNSESEGAANVGTAKNERRDHPNQEVFIVAIGVDEKM